MGSSSYIFVAIFAPIIGYQLYFGVTAYYHQGLTGLGDSYTGLAYRDEDPAYYWFSVILQCIVCVCMTVKIWVSK